MLVSQRSELWFALQTQIWIDYTQYTDVDKDTENFTWVCETTSDKRQNNSSKQQRRTWSTIAAFCTTLPHVRLIILRHVAQGTLTVLPTTPTTLTVLYYYYYYYFHRIIVRMKIWPFFFYCFRSFSGVAYLLVSLWYGGKESGSLSCNFNKSLSGSFFKWSSFVYYSFAHFSFSIGFMVFCLSWCLYDRTFWGVGLGGGGGGEGSETKVLMIWERVFQLPKGAWEEGWALPRRKPGRGGERDSGEELLHGCVRDHWTRLMWRGCLILPLPTPLSKVDVLLHPSFIFCLGCILWKDYLKWRL